MRTRIYLHLLFLTGFIAFFIPLLFSQVVDLREHPVLDVVIGVLAYFLLLLWSVFTFFWGRRNVLVTIESILGFLLTAINTPLYGRTVEFAFGHRSEYDESWVVDYVFIGYFHLTTLCVLAGPLLSNWWQRRKRRS